MTHWSCAMGFAGFVGSDGALANPADDGASNWSSSPLLEPSTCTWPNETANCSASASKAHQAPNRKFVRTQCIAVLACEGLLNATLQHYTVRPRQSVTFVQQAQAKTMSGQRHPSPISRGR